MTTTKNNVVVIEGHKIQCDISGVGNCWKNADEISCPANIQEEIACEIIDGKKESGEYRASNGQQYRW